MLILWIKRESTPYNRKNAILLPKKGYTDCVEISTRFFDCQRTTSCYCWQHRAAVCFIFATIAAMDGSAGPSFCVCTGSSGASL